MRLELDRVRGDPAAPPSDLIGQRVDDRYEVVRLLGEGGMGRVYLARQLMAQREVALKVIGAHRLRGPFAMQRFMDEARTACSMNHPNVVTVYDFGCSNGLFYLVMELLDGPTLRTLLGDGRLSPARAVTIAVQACTGLQEVHRRGIVHRDLKPENILLCSVEGIGELAKIVDFGLAEGVAAPSGEGGPRRIYGSPAYMCPEQIGGGLVDGRGDLYALGVVLYEMLAGRLPFSAEESGRLLQQHLSEAPPPLDGVPEELAQLVGRCLAKRPGDRPESALVLRTALERFLDRLDGAPAAAAGPRSERTAPVHTITNTGPLVPNWGEVRWRVGEVVVGRYRLTQVEHDGTALEARGVDLFSAAPVVLRRYEIADDSVRDAVELAFERWSALLLHVRHPRVAALLEYAWDGPALVLVHERLPEQSLRDRLARGRLSARDAVRIAGDLCDGLERLHELGIAHHRITPDAIRLGSDGGALLADVALGALRRAGLARGLEPSVDRDALYQAPEHPSELGGGPGPQADLYALGVVLYEMLTGRSPWPATSPLELERDKLRGAPVPPSQLVPGSPPPLDAIVERLLRPLPVERYRTVAALRHDLEQILGQEGEGAVRAQELSQLDGEGRLHGRAGDLLQLTTLVERGAQGNGALVVLRGAAGIGKTRLLHELAAEARRQGALVLRAKAGEQEGSSSFGGLRRLFAELWAGLGKRAAEERKLFLDGILESAGELGALLRPFAPFLDQLFSEAPSPPPLEEEAARVRLYRTLSAVLLGVAQQARPLCLVLDDVQWLDEGTRTLAGYLGQAVERAPLVVLAATRPVDDAVARALGGASAGAIVLDLAALSAEAVGAFVAERVGDPGELPQLVETLLRLSGGNPVSLRALLQQARSVHALAVDEQGRWRVQPGRLGELSPAEDVVRRMADRLETLSPEAVRVLGAGAVWGRRFDLDTVAALLEGSEREALVGALVEAERADVLRAAGTAHREFAHDLLREGARRLLSDDKRRELHRRAAQLVARAPEPWPEQVAEHLLCADERPEDIEWLERAAQAALGSYAGGDVVRFGRAARERLAQAGAASDRLFALDLAIAKGLALQRRVEESAALLRAVLAHRPGPSLEQQIEVREQLAHVYHVSGKLQEADDTLEGALRLLQVKLRRPAWLRWLHLLWRVVIEVLVTPKPLPSRPTRTPRTRADERHAHVARLLLKKAEVLFFFDPKRHFEAVLEAVHHGRRARDAAVYAESMAGCGVITSLGVGWVRPAARIARVALAAAEGCADLRVRATVGLYSLKIFQSHDLAATHGALADRTLELVARVGDAWLEGLMETFRAERDFQLGRLSGYVSAPQRLATLIAPGEQRRWFVNWARSYGALAALYSQQPRLARRLVADALADEAAGADVLVRCVLYGVRVSCDAACGRDAEVQESARAFLEFVDRVPSFGWYPAGAFMYAAVGLCESAVRLDDSREAARQLDAVLRRSRRLVAPYPVHRLYWQVRHAQLQLMRGKKRAAEREVARLLEGLRQFDEPNQVLAYVLRDLGLMQGGNATVEGRRLLRAALQRLGDADASLPLRCELAALLGDPPPPAADLTPVWRDFAAALGITDVELN